MMLSISGWLLRASIYCCHKVIYFSVKNEKNEKSDQHDFFINEINFGKRETIFKDIKKFSHSFYSLEAKKKLEKLILETKPDVAHLHNISHHISPSIFSVLKKYKIAVMGSIFAKVFPLLPEFVKNASFSNPMAGEIIALARKT